MTTTINPSVPMFLEVGKKFINIASIAYVKTVQGPHGGDVYIYLNVSKPDGKLQFIQPETPEEVEQVGTFVNAHLFGKVNET